MQRPLIPEPEPEAPKPRSCKLYWCDVDALPGAIYCQGHQPSWTPRRRCASCNSGAVMESGGKLVCSSCGYGRSTLPRAKRRPRK